ncbi:MAG: Bacterial alpha-L-rhamnosidase [Candidatus Aminicenantes bacterium]|nr:Bacterial alpha-L-rhamnosidase [Candidatus Aminicenantes bacterium]
MPPKKNMSHRFCLSVVLISFVFLSFGCGKDALQIDRVSCEYRINPFGIDTPRPRLSWVLSSDIRGQSQTAYQILAASSKDKLNESDADLWNSGKVQSRQSANLEYAGKALQSRLRCFWKVRVWGKRGKASEWSQTAWWEMAFLEGEEWSADWINDGKENPANDKDFYQDDPAPLFRKEFVLEKAVKKARLYITGLGYYEAYMNGDRIGDSVLEPGWTNYSKHIFYSVYDVLPQLKEGANCIGVILGNGWYNPLPLRMWGRLNLREHLTVGRPCFIAQLELTFTDGSSKVVISDESWKVKDGPILRNNIYLGEVYDARLEVKDWNLCGIDTRCWRSAARASKPKGKLCVQPLPPIRVTATLRPENITQPNPGIYIVDMGQNFAGWVRYQFKAPQGTQIRCRYAELLNEDGTLNPMTSVCGQIKGTRTDRNGEEVLIGGPGSPEIAWQADIYTAGGNGWETYTPRFTFHAFRYIEISGYPGTVSPDMILGLRLNSDVSKAGSFSCSNEMFNDIQTLSQWTFLSNLFSVQSDCPHRERFGYGGDIVSTNEALMFNYDMAAFYAKTVQDWSDSVLDGGMLTDTAPYVGIQYCGVGWALVHPLLQMNLYRYYGDRRTLEDQYAVSRRWLGLVQNLYPDFLVKEGLSDHESLNETPSEELVTPLYFYSAHLLYRMAGILKRSTEKREYEDLMANIESAYLDKFWQKDLGQLAPGTQTSQSFGLYLGLIPEGKKEKALAYLVKLIEENQGHLTTGILGTPFMLDVLCRQDLSGIAYGMVNKQSFPGWGHMLENGATTLWEHWEFSDNTYSHNHPMFGSVSQWFYNWLGGIQAAPEAVGFDKIVFRPQVMDDLQWVECSYESIRGKIVSSWHKKEGSLFFKIQIPVNAEAAVYLPNLINSQIYENGKHLVNSENIQLLRKGDRSLVYRVESGTYLFEIRRKKETNP